MPHSIENQELLSLLRTLLGGRIRADETEAVVRHAVRLGGTYLQWLSHRRGYSLQHLGVTLQDLAYDAVADLLGGEQEHCCAQLVRALGGSDAPTGDEDLLALFQSLLFVSIQQRIGRVFAEVNPLYLHLHNALRSHIHRRDDVVALDMLDGRWYCLRSAEEARLDLPAMPLQDLMTIVRPSRQATPSRVVGIFHSIMSYLDSQETFRKAVLEEDILRIARDFVGAQLQFDTPEYEDPEEYYDTVTLLHAIDAAIDESREWVEHKYLRLGRLTEQEIALFFEAYRMHFLDLMRYGDTESPYSYLRSCMPGLTHQRFRASYRHKFDYILARILETAQARLSTVEHTTDEPG